MSGQGRQLQSQRLFELEALEPRVLLSAGSDAAHALAVPLSTSLVALGDQVENVVADSKFNQPVPGLLQINHDINGDGKLDGSDIHTPGARDLLSINVEDRDGTAGIAALGATVDKTDVADVYSYVHGDKTFFTPSPEQALSAMDLNGDGFVSLGEAYKTLFVGAVKNYLANYTDLSGTQTVADMEANFLSFLQNLTEPSEFGTGAGAQDVIDLSVSTLGSPAVDKSDSSHFAFKAFPNITFKDSLPIDLGLTAFNDKIALPSQQFDNVGNLNDIIPSPGAKDPSGNPLKEPQVNVAGNLAFPLDFSENLPTPTTGGFTFDIPGSMTIAIDSSQTLQNFVADVGFLGTQVPGPAASSDFTLHLEWDISVTDPSSPTHLGFTDELPSDPINFKASTTTGTLLAGSALPGSISSDVIFDLQLGSFTPVHVTVPATTSLTAGYVGSQISGTAMDSLVSAQLSSGKLELVVASSDVTPLGFTGNENTASDTLTANNALSFGSPVTIDTQFMFSLDGALPKLVPLNVSGVASLSDLVGDVQTSLNAAGLGTVTVGSDGSGKITFTDTGHTLATTATQTLVMTAVTQITYAELTGPTPIFDAEPNTSNDKFTVDMPLKVQPGVAFTPSGSPKLAINKDPFSLSTSDLKPDQSNVLRFDLPLTLTDFDQYLDFNVIGATEIVGLLGQFQSWLTQLDNTDMLGSFKVPLAQAVLGKLLDFGDLVHDGLVADPALAQTPATSGTDTTNGGKLVAKVGSSVITIFGTAQELGARLNKLGLLTATPSATDFAFYDASDPSKPNLTYQVGITRDFLSQEVPVDFNLDLTPLANISSQSKVTLSGTGHLNAVIGIHLGQGAPSLTDGTTLSSLGGADAAISTRLALTGAADVAQIFGQLSVTGGDATFLVTLNGTESDTVTVHQSDTTTNRTIGDLVTDINTALANNAKDNLGHSVTGLNSKIQAVQDGDRIDLIATDPSVNSFTVTTATNDPAYTEIGFQTGSASTVSVAITPQKVNPANNLDVTFAFTTGSGTTTETIHLLSTDTAANVTLTDLVNDINAKIGADSVLNGKVLASRTSLNGNQIVFSGIDASISFLTVSASGTDAGAVGLGSPVSGGLSLGAPNDILSFVGRLSGDATFDVKLNGVLPTTAVDVTGSSTTDGANQNRSIDDLVADINAALTTAGLNTKLQAVRAGDQRIGLIAIDKSVKEFELLNLNTVASQELGFGAGPIDIKPVLVSAANKSAPSYFGPGTDATFKITVAGGATDSVTDLVVKVAAVDAIANQSIFDLVSNVNRALNGAFQAAGKVNPLVATNDGNRLVISQDPVNGTDVTAFHVTVDDATNSAVTDLKLYPVGTTPASPVTLNANQADLLIYTQDGSVSLVSLDGATTIKGVRDAINATGKVDAEINNNATGLTLTDTTVALPPPTPIFRVDSVNGSTIAQVLGIFGGDVPSTQGTVASTSQTANGRIDGSPISQLAALTPTQRFFFGQVSDGMGGYKDLLSADVTVGAEIFDGSSGSVVNAGADTITITKHAFNTGDAVVYENGGGTDIGGLVSGQTYYVIVVDKNTVKLASTHDNAVAGSPVAVDLTGTGTGSKHQLQNLIALTANFGFIGIAANAHGSLTGKVGIGLQTASGTVTLSDLVGALANDVNGDGTVDVFDLATLIAFPTLSISSGTLTLTSITVDAGLGGASFTAPTGTATVKISLSGTDMPFVMPAGSNTAFDPATAVDTSAGTITLTGHGFTTGDAVVYQHGIGGSNIGGLTDGTTYFVVKVDSNTLKLASSLANALATTPITIDLTSVGSGSAHLLNGFHPSPPTVSVDASDVSLGDLTKFENITFGDILNVLQGIKTFLDTFGALSFLSEKLPVLGISLNDLVSLATQFDQAVAAIQQDPAGALQELSQKISETFGLPTNANLFKLELVSGNVLKLSFDLSKSFSKALSVNLDLGPSGLPFHLLGTAGLQTTGSFDAKIALGVDLTTPTNLYLFTNQNDTSVTATLGARSNNLTFNASLGPLGIFITGGQVAASLSAQFATSDAPGTKVDLASALAGFQPGLTGTVKATLPVFFPTESTFVDDITFDGTLTLSGSDISVGGTGLTVPSTITGLDFHNFNLLDNLPLMVDAGDLFLSGIQDILDGQVFGIKLPLIGDKLADGAQFIENFRQQFIQPFRTIIQNATSKGPAMIQEILFDALGPGGSENIPGLGTVSIQGLGLLENPDGSPATSADQSKLAANDSTSPVRYADDLGQTAGDTNTSDDFVQWNFKIGQTYQPNINLGFDLGFPALSLSMDGGLKVSVKWALDLGFGISTAAGAYIDISRKTDPITHNEIPNLGVSIDVGLSNGTNLTGTLGFLQLVINDHTPFAGGDDHPDKTDFSASFGLDLQDSGNPTATQLSFADLGNLGVKIAVDASANVNLDLTAQFNQQLIPATISAILPKVSANFLLVWGVHTDDLLGTGLSLSDGLSLVEFRHVGVDLGSFLSNSIMPIVQKIQEVTGPLQPIIDIMTARIPVLSDLAGRTITLVDIAGAFGEVDPSMIYAIADIIKLINSIPTGSVESLVLPLGDFVIVDSGDTAHSLLGSSGATSLADPNFSFGEGTLGGQSEFASKVNSALKNLPGGLSSLSDLTSSGTLDTLLGGTSMDSNQAQTKDTVSSLFNQGFDTSGKGGFDFPIFKDPSQIFGLLLGRPAVLVTYDMPPFLLSFKYEQSFEIYGPLFGLVTAGIGFKVHLAFGYDTQGIANFASGGFSNPLDLLSGFYISGTDHPDGSGVDVPEMVLTGSIGVGAELNAGIASAGVTANIILTTNFNLYDPNHDGRVRINELLGSFLYELRNGSPALAPLAIFDISGNVSFQLSAFIKFLFAEFDFNVTPQITLFTFSVPFDREPILATQRGDGSLLLNIGPNSAARLNGDTRDISETIHAKDAGNGKIAVWSDQFGVPESAAQVYDGNKVVALGGNGDDVIDLSGISVPAEVDGGSGNDTITGGSGNDILKGGIGDDTINGGPGNDIIYGGDGNDTIDGGPGNDIIFGDSGTITTSSIQVVIGSKDGDDVISGGTGNDIIFGGGGNDKIGGDADWKQVDAAGGNDLIFGDGGRVDLDSGGNPILTTDTDPATGELRYPHISMTDLKGGGNDIIRGQGGDDIIFGGAGDDNIDGGAGSDVIYGESGFDTIAGGGGADTLFGGTEDDQIFGFRPPLSGLTTAAGGGTSLNDNGADYVNQGVQIGDRVVDLTDGSQATVTAVAANQLTTTALSGGTNNLWGNGDQYVVERSDATDGNDTIYGDAGNDFIRGNAGDDTIYGGAGADIIFGDTGDDTIFGQDGPDVVFGGAGNDTIDGGTGNDILFGDDGFVAYVNFFGSGSHEIIGFVKGLTTGILTLNNTQLDTKVDSQIRSIADDVSSSLDLIVTQVNGATDGNDTVIGGQGDDIILGGAKDDTLYGDLDPNQPLQGAVPAGNDILFGDGGRIVFDHRKLSIVQTIVATSPAETGADTISGNGGNDLLFGGGGNDTLYGRMDPSFDLSHPELAEAPTVTDNDIIIADDGEIDYTGGVIAKIFTNVTDPNAILTGGTDTAFGNKGDDIIFGGMAGDTLHGDGGGDGKDIILGDNGEIDFTSGQITKIFTTDTSNATGGVDTITGDEDADIIFGGVAGDILSGNGGNDIILGDNGELVFHVDLAQTDNFQRLDSISSQAPSVPLGLGGADTISGNEGSDIILGGADNDTIYGDAAVPGSGDAGDIILGDNGEVDFGVQGGVNLRTKIFTTDTTNATGGVDTIYGNAGDDIILGGVQGDVLYGNEGNDIIIGDNGKLSFDLDGNFSTLDKVETTDFGLGGADTISGNAGSDIILGAAAGDTIYGDDATGSAGVLDTRDFILGDNGYVLFTSDPAKNAGTGQDQFIAFGAAVQKIETTDTVSSTGGSDTIYGNAGDDIILGGVQGDTIHGGDGNDIILGDNGILDWLYAGDPTYSNIESQLPGAGGPGPLFDSSTTTLDLITTKDKNLGGRDQIFGDNGNDIIFGGTDSDTIHGNDGNDVLFGDHGRIYPQNSALPGFASHNFFSIDTGNNDGGQGDIMYGDNGDDIMIGGQGDDQMFGGAGNDDMIGGHNVAGGIDKLSLGVATLSASGGFNDLMDGGPGDDAMAGDNAIIWREAGTTSSRFRTIDPTNGTSMYQAAPTFLPNVTGTAQNDPSGVATRTIVLLDHSFGIQSADASSTTGARFGNDVMAGGSGNDTMFGELGDDVMQGDGSLNDPSTIPAPGSAPFLVGVTDTLVVNSNQYLFDVRGASTDGDDYMEGNGGNDLLYGDLGQDDIIGGSSDLFGLDDTHAAQLGLPSGSLLRPDGSDTIYGGAAAPDQLAHNSFGDGTATGVNPGGHSHDADVIMGDNADIFRIVTVTGGVSSFATFNYDVNFYAPDPAPATSSRIIPRAFQLLDYNPMDGLTPFNLTTGVGDIGAPDVIHGEAGDDIIHGETGSDIIYGEGQNDDIYGGMGNDWISGGTGDDAILGDDGKIFTSRNSATYGEPLYGIGPVTVDVFISTPGQVQTATINVHDVIKKSVDLEPYDLLTLPAQTAGKQGYDDIIFGGLGDDTIHGGMGDDAISGAEAMMAPIVNGSKLPYFYDTPGNNGDALMFGEFGTLKGYADPTEFAFYDQFHPLQKIPNFFLNFEATDGSGNKINDGNDILFGDTGNDWLVGGTGRDDMFGGWGNDLLDADDNKDTNGGLNNIPDDVNATPSYGDPDRAFGGAGLDVLIGNTGGDRLIDWVGEFNSYIVPFSPFGITTVSRTVQPQLPEFLYALSASDGADQTRVGPTLGTAARNGEPFGELGLVLQQDPFWHAQTGAPNDPQAGNTPGTQRDTRLVQNFSLNANFFTPAAGQWTWGNGVYAASPINGGDSTSLVLYNEPQQSYQELLATVNMDKSKAGTKSNGYIIFNYQSPTNFEFAGVDSGLAKLRIGQRTDQGWITDVQSNMLILPNTDYQLKVALDGNQATLTVNGTNSLSYTFAGPLNAGDLALGTDNSSTRFDNYQIQVLPPGVVRSASANFDDGLSDGFAAQTGSWSPVSGRYWGTSSPGSDSAISVLGVQIDNNYNLDYQATVNTQSFGGLIFDYQSSTDFKFAALLAGTRQIVIGHRTANGWYYDMIASQAIAAGTDYSLGVSIRGSTVSVTLNGQTKLSYTYSRFLTGGSLGLVTQGGASSFDNVQANVL